MTDNDGNAVRTPETLAETLLANFRPQPAIPAVLVMLLTILVPAMSHDPSADGGSVFLLLVPLGFLISCGLAVAAGFCSFAPQLIWIALAAWGLDLTSKGVLPAYNQWVLIVGMIVAATMFVFQIWRVRTGKFIPTIRIEA